MILMEQSIQQKQETLSLKLFAECTDVKLTDETLEFFMGNVRATAINYAKRCFKGSDLQFIDECIAEAYFWLVVLFEEFKDQIALQENEVGYIKMKIGYKLREYWAPYASSTMSYIKTKGGQIPTTTYYKENDLARNNLDIECFICLQSVLRTPLDWEVYEQHILGKTPKLIGTALNMKPKRVQKILAKIKKRLKVSKRKENADVSACC